MPESRSINQNPIPDVLPNFRNLGVVLRIMLIANGFGVLIALGLTDSLADIWQRMLHGSAFLQPVLLSSLLFLYAASGRLASMAYSRGVGTVLVIVAVLAWIAAKFGGELLGLSDEFDLWRRIVLSVFVAMFVLAYFRLRAQSLSPAISGARLQALQTRIRPHFLFNSINAVLGIVRSEPKRAEAALEDMADLFRMAMSDNRELVALQQEVELSRRYLALEQLRLGERLKVDWQIRDMPGDALIPPLMLQPLLENAVYHGIEPMQEGGEIVIRIYLDGKELHLDVYNPRQTQGLHHNGNKMALLNIRERLALQFDLEAKYSIETGAGYYRVRIMIPYIKESA